jgi:hypothetical protein
VEAANELRCLRTANRKLWNEKPRRQPATRKSLRRRKLIKLGKSKGYVTYDDVNDARRRHRRVRDRGCPSTLRESVEIREKAMRSGSHGCAPEAARPDGNGGRRCGADYVRMYMLTWAPHARREGEVTIAKHHKRAGGV